MGSVLQSFLLPVLFFFTSKSLRPRSDLSSWKKGLNWSSLHKKVSTQELVLLLPVEWSLLQSLLCCHSSGGKGRVKICKTVVTSGEPESREWVALFCFHWKWRELILSWHSPCYQKDQKFTSQNSLETRGKKMFCQPMCEICSRVMEAQREGVCVGGSMARSCSETDFYGCQLICLSATLAHVTSSRMQEWPISGGRLWLIVGG